MRFAIAIPQFYADGEFDPEAFGAYLVRAGELGFHSAWAQEQTLGSWPQLSPLEAMTSARPALIACGSASELLHLPERQLPPGNQETQSVHRPITAVPRLKSPGPANL